jgi:hypothetical protein
MTRNILDLAWGTAIIIATLLLADYATAQTPGGWNGRGPFIAFGRVWPTYIAPPRSYGPPAGYQPHFSLVPLVEPPPPTAIAPAATPALPPVDQAPLPIGWIYGPYTICADPPQCSTGMVNVQADGLNVRTTPDGFPVMALINGTPFIPLQRDGNWFLIAPACDLTPTWAWSWTANVPLNRCWVY